MEEAAAVHVDDVVEAFCQRLCVRQAHGAGPDKSMSLPELRVALGVTEPQLNEALWVLMFSGGHRIEYPAKDGVALGAEWRGGASGGRPHNDRWKSSEPWSAGAPNDKARSGDYCSSSSLG
jgi:hypothetical protein